MRTQTRSRKPPGPWPPPELCLPNLAELERLSRGGAPGPELASPHDTRTIAGPGAGRKPLIVRQRVRTRKAACYNGSNVLPAPGVTPGLRQA